MSEQELFDKIEAYIKNELSLEEQKVFEYQIANDTELAQEVKMHHLEHEAMNVLVAKQTKAKMAAWVEEPTTQNKRNRLLWIIGVSIVLGSLLFLLLWNNNNESQIEETIQSETENTVPESPIDSSKTIDENLPIKSEITTPDPEEQMKIEENEQPPAIAEEEQNESINEPEKINNQYLALAIATYNDMAPNDSNLRTTLKSEDTNQVEAEKAYKEGEFDKVITLLENEPNKSLLMYQMLGHAYFRTGDYQSATAAFEAITSSDDPAFARNVEFYLLLSYLAQGKQMTVSFTELLNKLTGSERHPNHDEAVLLRQEISTN